MKNYEINIKEFEDKIDLLHTHGFYLVEDKTYNISYLEQNYSRFLTFNRNTLSQLINLLENELSVDSPEVRDLLLKDVECDLWEFNKIKLNRGNTTRKIKYSVAYKSSHNLVRQMIAEDDEKIIFAEIPNGEFSDGRPRKYTTYKSPEAVKKIALNYIEDEISHLLKIRENIIAEGA